MNAAALFLLLLGYLGLLFAFAYWAERRAPSSWVQNPWVYTLTLGVYCTAWTYYGSVGVAARQGFQFLTIYLGPVISMPLWAGLMQKLVRISRQHRITSIADFIALRYGNNRALGAWVAMACLLAVIPYISLQLKAVSDSFALMKGRGLPATTPVLNDTTLYLALVIALFVSFFGTRTADVSQRRKGIMATVALESLLKLIFFLIAASVIVFGLYEGPGELYTLMKAQVETIPGIDVQTAPKPLEWVATIGLSFLAIFLLPRQFHVSVVEHRELGDIRKASWAFPLYLLLFNLLVIFVAWAGILRLGSTYNPDYYMLSLPLTQGLDWVAVLVFVGGFSAVLSMIVVSTLSLSTMLSNSLILPFGVLKRWLKSGSERNESQLKNLRRVLIFCLILLSYGLYVGFYARLSLYSIGLVSFVVIAQLAPSFFLGLIWSRGSALGARMGIVGGLGVLAYTLFYPTVVHMSGEPSGLRGLFDPHALFGLEGLSPEIHALFWSLSLNTLVFFGVSLWKEANYRERNYAELFINEEYYPNLPDAAMVWKGEAYVSDIQDLLRRFLGEERTRRALDLFHRKYNLPGNARLADPRLVSFSERLLSASLGPASARVLIDTVTKESPVSVDELFRILDETRQTKASNRELHEKSEALRKLTERLQELNEELMNQDQRKDEFLDTVAHELKTPVTSIQAASEVLEDPDMPVSIRLDFLRTIRQETERLGRLIHHILDLEKLSSGRGQLNPTRTDLIPLVERCLQSVRPLAEPRGISLEFEDPGPSFAHCDEDRIEQVINNLLSNALKFVDEGEGRIHAVVRVDGEEVEVAIMDNGRGVPEEDRPFIFDKFYQSRLQNTRKPSGSGFGLAISRKIVEGHGGSLWLDHGFTRGARFVFRLPASP